MPRAGKKKMVLGIDVGEHHSWCIAMDMKRRIHFVSVKPVVPQDLPAIIKELQPSVVAIDAPRSWARTGKSRQCERDLLRLGIHCFFTPSRAQGGKRFYNWVRTGINFYKEAKKVRCQVIEVFPHATTFLLRGAKRDGESKVWWRRRLLEDQCVAQQDIKNFCTNIHKTDAAICALTGILDVQKRTRKVGVLEDGHIVVPVGSP